MGAIASEITSLTIVYSTVYSGADQSKDQSSASLAFVWGIHRGPVNSLHKWPATRKMFPFDDVIMFSSYKHDNVFRITGLLRGEGMQSFGIDFGTVVHENGILARNLLEKQTWQPHKPKWAASTCTDIVQLFHFYWGASNLWGCC